jgi:hypothetical protein
LYCDCFMWCVSCTVVVVTGCVCVFCNTCVRVFWYFVCLYLLFCVFVLCFCIVSFMHTSSYLFCLYCHRVTTQSQLVVIVVVTIIIIIKIIPGATTHGGLGPQSGRRRSAKLVPTLTDRGVSRGQRNGSPRPFISVHETRIRCLFIRQLLN